MQKGSTTYGKGRALRLRHLPILGKNTYIEIIPLRGRCLDCDGQPTTTQSLSWYDCKSPHTKAYEQYVLLSLINSTIADVSIKEDLGYQAIQGIVDRSLKTAIALLCHHKEFMTAEEKKIIEPLFKRSPILKAAYKFCCQLTAIYNSDIDTTTAHQKINEWIESVERSDLICFNRFIETLKKYQPQIENYFRNRETSGFIEGFNNKVKVMKRRCYGIFNLKHLYQRLYLDVSGYALLGKQQQTVYA